MIPKIAHSIWTDRIKNEWKIKNKTKKTKTKKIKTKKIKIKIKLKKFKLERNELIYFVCEYTSKCKHFKHFKQFKQFKQFKLSEWIRLNGKSFDIFPLLK